MPVYFKSIVMSSYALLHDAYTCLPTAGDEIPDEATSWQRRRRRCRGRLEICRHGDRQVLWFDVAVCFIWFVGICLSFDFYDSFGMMYYPWINVSLLLSLKCSLRTPDYYWLEYSFCKPSSVRFQVLPDRPHWVHHPYHCDPSHLCSSHSCAIDLIICLYPT